MFIVWRMAKEKITVFAGSCQNDNFRCNQCNFVNMTFLFHGTMITSQTRHLGFSANTGEVSKCNWVYHIIRKMPSRNSLVMEVHRHHRNKTTQVSRAWNVWRATYTHDFRHRFIQIKQNGNAKSWWRHEMKTFSASLAPCSGNSPVTGEFPSQRPGTQSFDVFFGLRLNKRFSKQSRRRWSETP